MFRGLKRKITDVSDGLMEHDKLKSNDDDNDDTDQITRVVDQDKPKPFHRQRNSTGNLHLVKNKLSDKDAMYSGKKRDEERFNSKQSIIKKI